LKYLGLLKYQKLQINPILKSFYRKDNRYFKAIFPDKAVKKTYVNCHNNHPNSSKKDFKLGDVMGAISLSIWIENNSNSIDNIHLAPEIVSDYIHTVLEANKTVYSEIIVNRLQKINIAFGSENWREEDALLLPVQF
jgi:hypothetical protein